MELQQSELRDGVPCDHPGCLNHISHPCEGCGRIAGVKPTTDAKLAIVGDGCSNQGLVAALVMSMAMPFYLRPDGMPFDPPLSSLPEKPVEKTKYDVERIRAAIEKRKKRKLKRMTLKGCTTGLEEVRK